MIDNEKEIIKGGQILNGQKYGVWNRFFNNRKIGEIVFIVGDSNKAILRNYKLSNRAKQHTEGFIKDGAFIPHGLHVSFGFDDEHDTSITGFYYNGLPDGTWKTYNYNGSLYLLESYSEGKLNGEFMQYYNNSNIKAHGQYKNNLQIGEWKYYYENGNLREKGFYLPDCQMMGLDNMDEIDGYMEYFDYHPLNPLTQITSHCKKVGIWKTFNEDGNIQRIDFYKDGWLLDFKFIY